MDGIAAAEELQFRYKRRRKATNLDVLLLTHAFVFAFDVLWQRP
jgi:hypothetical protein